MSAGHQSCDVLVVGGGPAGFAASMTLSRAGLSVLVITTRRHRLFPSVETLPPTIVAAAQRLGVLEECQAAGFTTSPGIVAMWGSDEPNETDFFFQAFGCGWHVDREQFDWLLAGAAAKAGSHVWRDTTFLESYCTRNAIEAIVCKDGKRQLVKTRLLIDATGKAANVARQFGARRQVVDRLVGIYAVDDRGSDSHGDQRLWMEACEDGWWYSAPSPQRTVVCYLTDLQGLRTHKADQPDKFRQLLRSTRLMRNRITPAAEISRVRVFPAPTGALGTICGGRWLAIGDAAAAMDPLSGRGVENALDDGLATGELASDLLNGNEPRLHILAKKIRERFERELATRAEYYALENRWGSSPFWRRRARVRELMASRCET